MRVYLDYNATTPLAPQVREAMLSYWGERFGNPSSLHAFGREAHAAVDRARGQVAQLLGCRESEIILTSGGTEADNLAVKGLAWGLREHGKDHIVTSQIEHHAVLYACKRLEKEGFQVTYLPVDQTGRVEPEAVREALTERTALVTIMLANNETGTVQPIREIGTLCRERGVSFHTDAVQAVGKLPINLAELPVDLLSLSGHKIHGPKGAGALYCRRRGPRLIPLLHGGGHERGRRSGTENVPGIVGLGVAAELAREALPTEPTRLQVLRDRLEAGLKAGVEDLLLNGHPTERLCNTLNITFVGVEGEAMLLSLDFQGIAVSSGSACTSGSLDPSHVLVAMGLSPELAQSAIRFSLGRENTQEELDYVLETLPQIVEWLRSMPEPIRSEVASS